MANNHQSKFEKYIAESLPAIDQLKAALGRKGDKLDFSPQSLKFVDDWIKREFREPQENPQFSDDQKWWIVRFSYYIAEVVIRNLGAKWELDKAKTSRSFGNAIIALGKTFKVEPLSILVAHIANMRSIADWYAKTEAKRAR